MRAVGRSITSELIASTLPMTCPAMMSGPLWTATSPRHFLAGLDLEPVRRSQRVRADSTGRRLRAARRPEVAAGRTPARAARRRLSATAPPAASEESFACGLHRRMVGRPASFVADRNPQPSHSAIQVRTVGLQPSRGVGHVAAGHRQRARDERSLILVERVAQGMLEGRGVGKGRRRSRATRARPEAPPRRRVSPTARPACRIASRSTMFASSRTLPGQARRVSATIASSLHAGAG